MALKTLAIQPEEKWAESEVTGGRASVGHEWPVTVSLLIKSELICSR